MNKALVIGGAIFLFLITLIGGVVGYIIYTGSNLDASSKTYVDTNIPLVASPWSKDELLKRSSPQLLEIMNKNPGQVDQLFKKLSELGALKQYVGSKGEAFMGYDIARGEVITAKYVADAKFEKGDATFQVQLIQTSGEWQFLSFHVNSPIFLQ